MSAINLILNCPAALDWADLVTDFTEAGMYVEVPPGGMMPASVQAGGKYLMHCCISGATYEQIETVLQASRPVVQIFAAQDAFKTANPAYDPDIPETIEVDGEQVPNPAYEPPTKAVEHHPFNASIWQFMPDRPRFDGEGNEVGSAPQTALHQFQGHAPWPTR